eukprot:8314627-Alexandrium_andersonii.AAC.1
MYPWIQSRSSSRPSKAKSPPHTTRQRSRSALKKQHALAQPRANPSPASFAVHKASQRADAARAP